MNIGTWFLCVIWLIAGVFAGVGYTLGWFDVPVASLIVLIAFPLGVEVRAISLRNAR